MTADFSVKMPDDFLHVEDTMSMANSIEARVPLLDNELIELSSKIPANLKYRDGYGKYIFKKAMEPLLPRDIIDRRKQGFAIPLDRWFRRELRDVTSDALFGVSDGILNPDFLKVIWNQHQRGQYDRSSSLWAVLMFRKWQEAFGAS